MSRDEGARWTPTRPVPVTVGSATDVAGGPDGRIDLATSTGDDVFYAEWSVDEGWSHTKEVSRELDGAVHSSIGTGPNGRSTVAWMAPEGLALATEAKDGSFERPKLVRSRLFGRDGRVRVHVDDQGFRELVVLTGDGDLVHVEQAP
jgi:hypothetical protein